MAPHGAAILLSGAPFANDGTVLLGVTQRSDVRPLQRSTGAGVSGRGSTGAAARTATASEASYQLVQAVDLHVWPVGDGWAR